MSNVSPVLNGENTSGVGDFTTDASVNMVAALHDHISCAKPVPVDPFNSHDTKAGLMTYSCEFDHMYASLTDGTTSQKETTEKHLKELLLLHLDLIQQQSEQIVTKDKQISALRQENETLRQRLERMDRRVTLQKQREAPEVYLPSLNDCENPPALSSQFISGPVAFNSISPLLETESDTVTLPLDSFDSSPQNNAPAVVNNRESVPECETVAPNDWELSKRRRKDTESASVSSSRGGASGRRRLSSWTSSVSDAVSHDGRNSVSKVSGRRRVQKRVRSKAAAARKDAILTTETLYYTPVGDLDSLWCGDEPEPEGNLEVPSWRYKVYTSCYSMEGTENLDDEVFNRRHQRLEIDERRRKRWDVQRIREQRQIEKLKSREQAAMRKGLGHNEEPMSSFWPQVDDAEYLEVGNTIPVAAFGLPITKFTASEFSLPWLTSARCKNSSSSHSSSRRRHEHKR